MAVNVVVTGGGPAEVEAARAAASAWTAGHHAAGAKVEPFRPDTVVHAVYSNPEVAQVGNHGSADTRSLSYQRLLRSQLSDREGFIKLGHDEKQKITGAVAVGWLAADPWCCLRKCCILPVLRFEGKTWICLFSVSSEHLGVGGNLDLWESRCQR